MSTGCAPLVIGLHGAGDTGSNFLAYTQLPETGSKHGFLVAGPDALNKMWFSMPSPDGKTSTLENDVALVQQIIADAEKQYRIDEKRIYVCGWSRGAGFAGLLAAASGNQMLATQMGGSYASPFAAFGMSAGFNYFGNADYSQSAPKRPGWLIHGTNDQAVPFMDGQQFANMLMQAGWNVKFTPIQGAPHDWLWQSQYKYSNEDLWNFFQANPLP
jgi:polyhydroxybutyrate depolymerase